VITYDTEVVFQKAVVFTGGVTMPAESIPDSAVKTAAGLQSTKIQQRPRVFGAQGDSNDTVVADTRVIYVVSGATGTLRNFRIGCVTACTGNATITIDLKKNGTTVLAAPKVLDNSQIDRQSVEASIQTQACVQGDVFELVVTVNAGTGALGAGLFWSLTLEETAT